MGPRLHHVYTVRAKLVTSSAPNRDSSDGCLRGVVMSCLLRSCLS